MELGTGARARGVLVDDIRNVTPEIFWQHVDKSATCWLWTGPTMSSGYGLVWYKGHRWLAHRLAWVLCKGVSIDSSLELDHLCRDPKCVNPSHLDAVSHRTNILRGIGPSACNARKTRCIRGHDLLGPRTSVLYRKKSGNHHRLCLECQKERHNRWWAQHKSAYNALRRARRKEA
mgnify:CR=1 FL=1